MIDLIRKQLKELKSSAVKKSDYIKGEKLYLNGTCQVLTQARQAWKIKKWK